MLRPRETSRFRKDLKRARKRGKNIEKLKTIVRLLAAKTPLPEKNRDHDLHGSYEGFRECHIEPDWLLVYYTEGKNSFWHVLVHMPICSHKH